MKTKNNIYVLGFAVCLSLLSIPASAATADGSIVGAVQAALETAAKSQILPQAIMWLGSFMGIQLLITNLGLLKSGADIEAVFAKLLGSLLWFGFVVYVMNNGADFIDSVGTSVINKFMPTWLSPGYILAIVTTIAGALITGIGLSGIMVLGSGSPMLALVLTVIMFVIVGVGLYVSIKIFMLKLELGLILVLAPLSFSLLGLNALKDQGIAPFKALISLIYRIVLFGIVCTAFKEVGTVTTAALDAIDWGNIGGWVDAIKVVFSAMFAFPMLGYLVYKSDSIASSLAGGSTNMGPGDIAAAAAAGAAAGAVVASGGAVVGSGNPVQTMSNFMKSLGGSGGSVSNASSMGAGGSTSALPLFPTPVASLGSGSSGGSGAEAAAPSGPSSNVGASTQAKNFVAPEPSPPPKSVTALLQDSQNASSGASAAGAPPQAVKAAGDAAYGSGVVGGSPQQIEDAVVSSGGTQEQGRAAAAAVAAPATAPGSGATETIGGRYSDPQPSNTSNKKSLRDNLSNLGHHMSQEKAATHVSINTHHSD